MLSLLENQEEGIYFIVDDFSLSQFLEDLPGKTIGHQGTDLILSTEEVTL